MELNRIKNKNSLLLITGILLFIFAFKRYEAKKAAESTSLILINEKEELNKKIENEKNILKEKEEKNKLQTDKLFKISQDLDSNLLRNESQFKKFIYLYARKSGLIIREIGKSESLWNKNGYSLKYVSFTFEGDLTSISNFLYLVHNGSKYIDMSRSYMEITKEKFQISIGFIEKSH